MEQFLGGVLVGMIIVIIVLLICSGDSGEGW